MPKSKAPAILNYPALLNKPQDNSKLFSMFIPALRHLTSINFKTVFFAELASRLSTKSSRDAAEAIATLSHNLPADYVSGTPISLRAANKKLVKMVFVDSHAYIFDSKHDELDLPPATTQNKINSYLFSSINPAVAIKSCERRYYSEEVYAAISQRIFKWHSDKDILKEMSTVNSHQKVNIVVLGNGTDGDLQNMEYYASQEAWCMVEENSTNNLKYYFHKENKRRLLYVNVIESSLCLSIEEIFQLSNWIEKAFERREPVLVHCSDGISRTPIIIFALELARLLFTMITAVDVVVKSQGGISIFDSKNVSTFEWDTFSSNFVNEIISLLGVLRSSHSPEMLHNIEFLKQAFALGIIFAMQFLYNKTIKAITELTQGITLTQVEYVESVFNILKQPETTLVEKALTLSEFLASVDKIFTPTKKSAKMFNPADAELNRLLKTLHVIIELRNEALNNYYQDVNREVAVEDISNILALDESSIQFEGFIC